MWFTQYSATTDFLSLLSGRALVTILDWRSFRFILLSLKCALIHGSHVELNTHRTMGPMTKVMENPLLHILCVSLHKCHVNQS